MRFVFGPVPSRRLGLSLGVDIVPEKHCTLNCLYCQVGKTKHLTTERRSFFPPEEILAEVRDALAAGASPDYVTFSGSGEPTLNSDLGALIVGVRKLTDTRICVLTNGTMLIDPEVRRQVALADLVVPSLDAATEAVFRRLNRPHPEITVQRIVDGIAALRRESKVEIWLEVMIVAGVNDHEEELLRIKELADRIDPHRIQLNTVARPPQDPSARAVSGPEMAAIRALFGPRAEEIRDFRGRAHKETGPPLLDAIVEMVKRRSITVGDLESAMGIGRKEAQGALDRLVTERRIRKVVHGDRKYYQEAF
jgi:wyosine [tRNA(Phe)-imidazoG37] synthetase (radical SAM superfamily)